MKIISNFKDYYDSIQQHGQDQSLVYLRQPREIPAPTPYRPDRENGRKLWVAKQLVGFCGVCYPMVDLCLEHDHKIRRCCYSLEAVDAFVKEHLSASELAEFARNGWRRRIDFITCEKRKTLESFFTNAERERHRHRELFLKLRCPQWLSTVRYGNRGGGEHWLILHGRLADVEFYRLFDPYRAYQEVAMFLGNIAAPDKPIPAIDDKTMAEAKGFTDPYCFRKEPKKRD